MAAKLKPIRVHFEDRGQACLWWVLTPPEHRYGSWEVTSASAEAWAWVPTKVARNSVRVGKHPIIIHTVLKGRSVHHVPIVRIERIDTQQQAAARASHAVQRQRKAAGLGEVA